MDKNDTTNLLKGTLKFPGGGLKEKVAVGGAGASIFVPNDLNFQRFAIKLHIVVPLNSSYSIRPS